MNFVQQLEECLRDLAAEARKKHPGVKEASERATLRLRTLQTSYVAAVRKATHNASHHHHHNHHQHNNTQQQQQQQHPTTAMFQSSDLLHPFLLAANYPNADYKLLEISFRAMRLLMEADAVVPTDGIHMVRVYQIQAQVVTAYYQKYFAKEIQSYAAAQQQQQYAMDDDDDDDTNHDSDNKNSNNNNKKPSNSSSSSTAGGIASSWFGWASSTSSAATSSDNSMNHHDYSSESTTTTIPVKNAVSSSSGQSGQAALSGQNIEKLALEILSSLLQLLQLLRNYPGALTEEIWSNSVSLTCLWCSLLPTHTTKQPMSSHYHRPQSNTVQQAAHSTVNQIVGLLFQTNTVSTDATKDDDSNNNTIINHKFIQNTWADLITLTASDRVKSKQRGGRGGDGTSFNLNGAFKLCQKRTRSYSQNSSSSSSSGRMSANNSSATSLPPSPEFALELMIQIWKETSFMKPNNENDKTTFKTLGYDELLVKTMGVTLALLQQMPKLPVEKSLRVVQWTLALCHTHANSYPNECRELFLHMLSKQIPLATTACRRHHDFEDGFVFSAQEAAEIIFGSSSSNSGSGSGNGTVQQPQVLLQESSTVVQTSSGNDLPKRRHTVEQLGTCFPTPLLWKAGFVLEATYHILDKEDLNSKGNDLALLFEEDESGRKAIQVLTEALSDFATVGTSCRDHILQTVEFCRTRNASSFKPKLFRKAEQAVATGTSSLYFSDSDAATTASGKHSVKRISPTPILGEAIWIALQVILRIGECLLYNKSIEDPKRLLEEIFPSSLAVLQHFMKRFVASEELVQLTLKGYSILADVCLPMKECEVQRKVLLSSLTKLSLPAWGKHDPASQLQDHHVLSLLCLLRIVHLHFDRIGPEFEIIMWTFEELSMLSAASPLLSDSSYHASLALSAAYSRFSGFSTCLSNESLKYMATALADICESIMNKRDIAGDSETVLPERNSTSQQVSTPGSDMIERGNLSESRESSSIGGKIMSMGVRAIYGSSGGGIGTDDLDKTEDMQRQNRRKMMYYQDYRDDFVRRIAISNTTVRINSVGRLPFALMLLADVAMANIFRQQDCGQIFSAQFSRLAASTPIIRPLMMDIMTMLVMAQLSDTPDVSLGSSFRGKIVVEDPMYSQLLAVEPENGAETSDCKTLSQAEVLGTVCKTIKTTDKADVAQSTLSVLNAVLEGAGEKLQGQVWSIIIDAIASLSGGSANYPGRTSSEWAPCCLMAFKSLKLIVDDFLDSLPNAKTSQNVTTHMSLLDCCSSFVISRHDINTSLTAIGLLWTIADQDNDSASIDRALSKLVILASDDRTEVRNAAVNTLFSCIAGRGSTFSSSYWESCMTETIFKVFDIVTEKSRSGEPPQVEEKNLKGPKSRYKVNLHHSRDSAGKQWVVTQVLVLRGLTRVLKNFFSQLLDSVNVPLENNKDTDDVPWFQDAWVRILDYAFYASGQGGGRENLDIRSAGIELLVVCCQLSSNAGIQAAITPASVSTRMEVVNGALRNVREEQAARPNQERLYSSAVSEWRGKIFLEAFESLECYDEEIVKKRTDLDDIDLQVLHKFCSNLSKLYDCCKEKEFLTDNTAKSLQLLTNRQNDAGEIRSDLEERFVLLIASTLEASTVDLKARFLNQTQRCAIGVLETMAMDGSATAFNQLVALAGPAFFVRKEVDPTDNNADSSESDVAERPSILSFEAAATVAREISKETVSDECKMLVLSKILHVYSKEFHVDGSKKEVRRRRYYKTFVPIIESGLRSVSRFSQRCDDPDTAAVDTVWKDFTICFKDMLSPIRVGKDMFKIPRVPEVMLIISCVQSEVPIAFQKEVCSLISHCASESLAVAKQHAVNAKFDPSGEKGKKSRLHRDDLLKLFATCFSCCSSINPEDANLQSVASSALKGARDASDESRRKVCVEASLSICQILVEKIESTETIILSVFSSLSNLVVSDDNKELRAAARKVLESADVGGTLERARQRYMDAERRADEAEKRVRDLEAVVLELQRQNAMLRR